MLSLRVQLVLVLLVVNPENELETVDAVGMDVHAVTHGTIDPDTYPDTDGPITTDIKMEVALILVRVVAIELLLKTIRVL